MVCADSRVSKDTVCRGCFGWYDRSGGVCESIHNNRPRLAVLTSSFWVAFYDALYLFVRDDSLRLMNWGFASLNESVVVDQQSYQKQLYTEVVRGIEFDADAENSRLLEVGCGNGGGLKHIQKHFGDSVLCEGVDLSSSKNVISSMKFGVTTRSDDAERLSTCNDHDYSIVVNVERSHCYSDFESFAQAVKRVLRPAGYFCYTYFAL